METEATLEVVRTREKRVLIHWKIEKWKQRQLWKWSEQEKSVFLYTGR